MGGCRGYAVTSSYSMIVNHILSNIKYWFKSILSTLPHELSRLNSSSLLEKLKVLTFSVFPSTMFSIINVEGQGHANLQN